MPKTQAKRGLSPRELDDLRKQYAAEQKQADSASKWQLANDIASGINDIVGRGVIAPILGMPGDINQAIYDAGAWVNNKIKDVEVATGMVKQPRYVQPSQGNAYLGSENIGNRMQQAGLVSSERRPMTELAASFVSPSAAAKTAINAPKTAMNMLRMAENLEAPSRGVRNAQGMYIPRGQMGAIENLWHGSPHTFDRFDLSKIGTGEGAQAYGHGAYLAENEAVAKGYRDTLSKSHRFGNKYYIDGKEVPKSELTKAQQLAMMSADDPSKASQIQQVKPSEYWSQSDINEAVELASSGRVSYSPPSNLYQARLAWPDAAREAASPLSPDDFLHWDKPLSEQSPQVQAAVRPILSDLSWDDRGYGLTNHFGSEDFPMDLMDEHGKWSGRAIHDVLQYADESSSFRLGQAGIPGIRYLDGGSRGAGEGSHNYVVFDDKLIDIVSRNGQPINKAVSQNQPAYGISHRPMTDEGGAARLHDLAPVFGDDIYSSNALRYFGSGDSREQSVLRQLHMLKGKPDADVTIYRGVPDDADGITPGDWVTLSREVASEYGPKVIEMRVKARDLTSWPDSLLEFGYYPKK